MGRCATADGLDGSAPEVEPREARLELARRHMHVFGPTTPAAFAQWAGIPAARGSAAFEALAGSLVPVRTPVGDAWILASDELLLRDRDAPALAGSTVRLVPSGDAYFLLHGADRELLVPAADRRRELWTPRVWPGAILVGGEVVGTWRRAHRAVSLRSWRRLARTERDAVVAEAESLPLPDGVIRMAVAWAD